MTPQPTSPYAAPKQSTPTNRSEVSPLVAFLLFFFAQFPLWLLAGVGWSLFMMAFAGSRPVSALIGGFFWAISMWVVMGAFFSIAFAWRRSATFAVPDRGSFRAVLDEACRRSRLIVLAESPDRIVLGPKWAMVRSRLQEVVLAFDGDTATLTAPALSPIRKQLQKALAAEAT